MKNTTWQATKPRLTKMSARNVSRPGQVEERFDQLGLGPQFEQFPEDCGEAYENARHLSQMLALARAQSDLHPAITGHWS